tara:strand:+ start:18243 stop:18416 length:174 start_codon:yes stop_codon:yes gene_type:complete
MMDINVLRGILTVVLFVLFMLLVLKIYSPKQKKPFKEASMLPFEDEIINTGEAKSNE